MTPYRFTPSRSSQEKGARLSSPVALMDEMKPMGRGVYGCIPCQRWIRVRPDLYSISSPRPAQSKNEGQLGRALKSHTTAPQGLTEIIILSTSRHTEDQPPSHSLQRTRTHKWTRPGHPWGQSPCTCLPRQSTDPPSPPVGPPSHSRLYQAASRGKGSGRPRGKGVSRAETAQRVAERTLLALHCTEESKSGRLASTYARAGREWFSERLS